MEPRFVEWARDAILLMSYIVIAFGAPTTTTRRMGLT